VVGFERWQSSKGQQASRWQAGATTAKRLLTSALRQPLPECLVQRLHLPPPPTVLVRSIRGIPPPPQRLSHHRQPERVPRGARHRGVPRAILLARPALAVEHQVGPNQAPLHRGKALYVRVEVHAAVRVQHHPPRRVGALHRVVVGVEGGEEEGEVALGERAGGAEVPAAEGPGRVVGLAVVVVGRWWWLYVAVWC